MRLANAILLVLLSALSTAAQFTVPQRGSIATAPVGPTLFVYVANSVTACYSFSAGVHNCIYAAHSAPVAGQLRDLCSFWADTGAQTVTITSSNGDSWSALTPGKVAGTGGNAGFSGECFKVYASAGGADTITMALGSGTTSTIGWGSLQYTYTGVLSSADGTPVLSNKASSANIATTDSVTTIFASDLLLAACTNVSTFCSVGTGWVARNDATGTCNWDGVACASTNNNMATQTGFLLEEKVNIAAGTYTATFGTTDASDPTVIGLVAF